MSEIECPACEARYRVPASAIGPEGRRVQCARCGEIWFARPIEEKPVEEALETTQAALAAPAAVEAAAEASEQRPVETADEALDHSAAAADTYDADPYEDVTASAVDAGEAFIEGSVEPAGEPAPERRAEPGEANEADAETGSGASSETEAEGAEEDSVARLPARPRQRRSWRDLKAAEEADDEEEEEIAPISRNSDGKDPFAERLARLRQTSLAPDPVTRRPPSVGDAVEDAGALRAEAGNTDVALEESEGAQDAATVARTALEDAEEDAPAAAAADPRADQMAEIRRMLDEMKVPGSDATEPDAEVDKAFKRQRDVAGIEKMAPSPAAPPRKREEFTDPLREKLLDPEQKARRDSADGEKTRAGLMRKHQKRTRRRQLAERTRKSRGGYYTGLVLVLAAAGMLAGVYAFADQIKERVPGTAGAIDDYVASVDRGRAALDDQLAGLRARIDLIIEVMLDD
ncbi:MAG: zinc-ribbon domain-containing protein [Pseudomonadota bacterium]